MYLFINALEENEYEISNNSETTVKPIWISLPSAASTIHVPEICEMNDHSTSNSTVSTTFECLDFVENDSYCDLIVLTPHFTRIYGASPQPPPTFINVSKSKCVLKKL